MPDWSLGPGKKSFGANELIGYADYAISNIRMLRVTCGSTSRLTLARGILEQFRDDPKRARELPIVAEAARTIIQFYLIARTFRNTKTNEHPSLAQLLTRSQGGPVDARIETDASASARNFEFELSMGAYFASGGLGIAIAEPDLCIKFGEDIVGVAAKRVRGRGKFMRRVKDAAAQIAKSGLRGIVALNVDSFIGELPHADTADVAGANFFAQLPEYAEAQQFLVAQPTIRGLIIHGTRVIVLSEGVGIDENVLPRIEMATYQVISMFASDDEEREVTNKILDEFAMVQRQRVNAVMGTK
jgi:hypothetical protein